MSGAPGNGACDRVRGYLDSYASNELPVEMREEVPRHVAECPACAAEFQATVKLKARLRDAAGRRETPADLEARVRANIGMYEAHRLSRRRFVGWTAGVAAALAIGFGSWETSRLAGRRRGEKLDEILRIGLEDHVQCAVPRMYTAEPVSRWDMNEAMGPEYNGLISVVLGKSPTVYRLEDAHRCTINGRHYIHMILRGKGALVSVVLSKKGASESIQARDVRPTLEVSGMRIYQSGLDHYDVAAFETRDYVGFVVSNLPERPNLDLARRLAPEIGAYLKKLEG